MLKAQGVKKTFFPGSVNEKRALRGVDLTLEDGDFATVIGSNGAGKSTFLNAIAGVFPIDSGTIEVGGVDISDMPEYKRAQYIEENLAMASRRGQKLGLSWSSKPEQTEKFREMLKELDLGLEERMTAHVGLLSGGQRQALTLLMATLVRPQLLLLDEHTAALDPKTAAKVLELTDRLVTTQKLTTLMITHNMRDALRYGNRLVMMHAGRIVVDVKGDEKKHLTVPDLLALFEKGAGEVSDAMMLSS